MPAAAVIPASAAYTKVAAVKRLAVEFRYRAQVRWTLGRGYMEALRLWALLAAHCLLSQAPVRKQPPRSRTWMVWLMGRTLVLQEGLAVGLPVVLISLYVLRAQSRRI